jgi:hypothetical protein
MYLCRDCAVKYTGKAPDLSVPRLAFRRACHKCDDFTYVAVVPDAAILRGSLDPMQIVVIADRRQLLSTPADVAELLANPLKGFVTMSDGLTGERFEVSTADSEDPIGNPNGLDFVIIGRKP